MTAIPAAPVIRIRALCADDLDRLVAIDLADSGESRRRFLEKRLHMQAAAPTQYLQFGAETDGHLAGFVLARVQRGEYGRADSSAVIDVLGVARESRGQGCGRALMDALMGQARTRGLSLLRSQAEWTTAALLRFFASSGFELSGRLVLERSVTLPFDESPEEI